jgi:hypothetical protein
MAKVMASKYFNEFKMTKATKEIVKKVDVLNVGNTKPPQWDGKKASRYLMWKVKFNAHMTMIGLKDALMLDFATEFN